MPVDITVYLPDDIGAQAKEAGMNLSRTLRDAVESELERARAMKEFAKDAQEWLLHLERDGWGFEGRIVGTLLCENRSGHQVFVTEDGRLILYYPDEAKYYVMDDDADALREALKNVCDDMDEYISAMAQLGYTATVDL